MRLKVTSDASGTICMSVYTAEDEIYDALLPVMERVDEKEVIRMTKPTKISVSQVCYTMWDLYTSLIHKGRPLSDRQDQEEGAMILFLQDFEDFDPHVSFSTLFQNADTLFEMLEILPTIALVCHRMGWVRSKFDFGIDDDGYGCQVLDISLKISRDESEEEFEERKKWTEEVKRESLRITETQERHELARLKAIYEPEE